MHRVCWFCQKNSENEESNIIKDVPEILERESATGTTGDTFETVKYVECDIVIPRCKSCETYHDEREQIPLEVCGEIKEPEVPKELKEYYEYKNEYKDSISSKLRRMFFFIAIVGAIILLQISTLAITANPFKYLFAILMFFGILYGVLFCFSFFFLEDKLADIKIKMDENLRIQKFVYDKKYNKKEHGQISKLLSQLQKRYPKAKPYEYWKNFPDWVRFERKVDAAKKELNPYKYATYQSFGDFLTEDAVEKMILEKDYHDLLLNINGQGMDHQYEVKGEGGIVYDASTDLTWQKSGSGSKPLNLEQAKTYINQLNVENYGGYSDWRLPTLTEAMALVEPVANSDQLYLYPIFSSRESVIWTADKEDTTVAWVVDFHEPNSDMTVIDNECDVRAVRGSMK